jgi:hypothetical protein
MATLLPLLNQKPPKTHNQNGQLPTIVHQTIINIVIPNTFCFSFFHYLFIAYAFYPFQLGLKSFLLPYLIAGRPLYMLDS